MQLNGAVTTGKTTGKLCCCQCFLWAIIDVAGQIISYEAGTGRARVCVRASDRAPVIRRLKLQDG